jgi:hypothetical protein
MGFSGLAKPGSVQGWAPIGALGLVGSWRGQGRANPTSGIIYLRR